MTGSLNKYMQTLGQQARAAARVLSSAPTDKKNAALSSIYTALEAGRHQILAANAKDMQNGKARELDAALLDRLELTPARFDGMLQGLRM